MSVFCVSDLFNYLWSRPWKFKPAVKQLGVQNWGNVAANAGLLAFGSRCHNNSITSVLVLFSWLIRSPWDIYSWFRAHVRHKTSRELRLTSKQALDVNRNTLGWSFEYLLWKKCDISALLFPHPSLLSLNVSCLKFQSSNQINTFHFRIYLFAQKHKPVKNIHTFPKLFFDSTTRGFLKLLALKLKLHNQGLIGSMLHTFPTCRWGRMVPSLAADHTPYARANRRWGRRVCDRLRLMRASKQT